MCVCVWGGGLTLRGSSSIGYDRLIFAEMKEGRFLVLNKTNAVSLRAASWSKQGQRSPWPNGEEALAARGGCTLVFVSLCLHTQHKRPWECLAAPTRPTALPPWLLCIPHLIPSGSTNPYAQLFSPRDILQGGWGSHTQGPTDIKMLGLQWSEWAWPSGSMLS